MINRHTPGPWVARKDGTVQPYPGTGCIASCSLRGNHLEMMANARAIAEVPAMIKALREIYVDDDGDGYCSAEHAREVRAILARIDGGAG